MSTSPVCQLLYPKIGRGKPHDKPHVCLSLQVRRNLHVVFSFSPVGDAFRERLSRFPSLVNCTTIDWFTAWPRDALATVATNFLSGLPGASEKVSTLPWCGWSVLALTNW